MNITIKNEILKKIPLFHIVAYTMDIIVKPSDETKEKISQFDQFIKEEYSLEDILNIPLIKEARNGYKALGKDPSRYRLACESLLRRLVKGFGLTPINNVVDVGNLLSIALYRSTAIVDLDLLKGDIYIRLGTEDDVYYGIGRGKLNVNKIPLYVDDISPFGSPTSDTERTAVSHQTKSILLMVICFGQPLSKLEIQTVIDMFTLYANATNIKAITVLREGE